MASDPAKAADSVAPPALGKYYPIARLGQGGMADVFLAVARGPVGFNKLVVVKRMRGQEDAGLVAMFLDEARLSARLNHPNIVDTYEVGEVKGQFFIAMEYLEGQTLQSLLRHESNRGKGLDETLAAWIAAQAASGLHYAHELSDYDGTPLHVVHRDVSPHNLFLTYRGEVKLLDFGIAKAALNASQTETGVLKGKVRYMAPEQIGEKKTDRRADVYALGVVLWEMMAGRTLFQGDFGSVIRQIDTASVPPIRTVRADASPRLEAIIARAMHRDVSERYPTAEAMRMDLEALLRERPSGADAALARLVNDLFAETREGVRARIKAFLAETPEQAAAAQSARDIALAAELLPPLFTEASGSGSGDSDDRNLIRSGRKNVFVPPHLTVSTHPASPRRAGAIWFVAVACLAAVAVAFFALRAREPRTPAATAAAPLSPAASAPVASTSPVHFDSAPVGAVIEWNGKVLGRTPADVQLPAGSQTLTLSQDGFQPQQVTLEVKPPLPDARAVVLAPLATAATSPSASAAPDSGRSPSARPRPGVPQTAPPSASASAARPRIRVVGDDDAP